LDVLITGEKNVEAGSLSGIQEFSVDEALPTQNISPAHLVSAQETGKRCGGIGVEKDFHATAAGRSSDFRANSSTAWA